MEKYYTPEIEEFHVGFEYEVWDKVNYYDNFWKMRVNKMMFTIKHLTQTYFSYNLQLDLQQGKIRVKYLDREDIESLGWTLDKVHEGENQELFHKDNIVLFYRYDSKELGVFTADPSKSDYFATYNRDPYKVNMITIKNKSELIKLLKQLKIMK